MRKFGVVFALVLAVAVAFGTPFAHAAQNFEIYGHMHHSHLNFRIEGGPDLSGPGMTVSIGGRYWFPNNMAVGVMAEWNQDRFTQDGVPDMESSVTGFLGTFSYRFSQTERMNVTGMLGVGSFHGEIKGATVSDIDLKATIGYLAALQLDAHLTDRATLSGQIGWRFTNFSEANFDAFSLGVGLGYLF